MEEDELLRLPHCGHYHPDNTVFHQSIEIVRSLLWDTSHEPATG
jgi:hypothetical protein